MSTGNKIVAVQQQKRPYYGAIDDDNGSPEENENEDECLGLRKRSHHRSISESISNLIYHSERALSEGPSCSVRHFEGTATILTEVVNLIKNIVGSGMFTLPSGVAAFEDAPSAVVPAVFYTFLTAIIFGYFFHLIGRTCKSTDSVSKCTRMFVFSFI
jgi:hypothetical protein